MSLRKLVFFLLIANLAYFAYSHDWFARVLGSDMSQREPDRMNKQINTDSIHIQLPAAPTPPAQASVPAPPTPLPLTASTVEEQKSASLSSATQPTSASPEKKCPTTTPQSAEQWIVYMGPYPNKDRVERKKTELTARGVSSSEISKTSLPRGLSLGSYSSEEQARQALQRFQQKGVKTATVLLWSTGSSPLKSNC